MADAAGSVLLQPGHFDVSSGASGGAEEKNNLFAGRSVRRISLLLVVCRPYFPLNAATHYSGAASSRARWWISVLEATEPFNLYLEVGLVAGLFAASPFVFYQFWLFVAPGLYRKEKRYILPFLISTVGLFITGAVFGYRMVYPASLDFLIGYGHLFQPMITIGEYTKLFLTIIVGLGLVFEMPIVVFFLALMRLITARWMWRNLRYSVLAIFVIAAIVTPTTDILNMCLFATPMVALYGVSIGIAWLVNPSLEPQSQIS